MLRKLPALVPACALPAAATLAQTPSGSRLDEIASRGKLRVCPPGDYKPFSFQRPDGAFESLDIDLVDAAAKALKVAVAADAPAQRHCVILSRAGSIPSSRPAR